jgi:group I intron endonuclease
MFGITGKDHPRFGISLSDDIINNMSEAQKKVDRTGGNNPMYGKQHCSETIAKMSIVKGGGIIYVYDLQGSLINSFSSARKAAKFFSTNHQAIMRYVRNGEIFKEQWKLSSTLISNKVNSDNEE